MPLERRNTALVDIRWPVANHFAIALNAAAAQVELNIANAKAQEV